MQKINLNIDKNLIIESATASTVKFLKENFENKKSKLDYFNYIDVLAENWYTSKKGFIEMFGGKTRIEKTVETGVDNELYENCVTDFIVTLKNGVYSVKREKYEAKKVLYKTEEYTVLRKFFSMILSPSALNQESFAKNIVHENIIHNDSYESICNEMNVNINKFVGMKLSKMFLQVLKFYVKNNIVIENIDDEKIANKEIDIISQEFSKTIERLKTATKKQSVTLSCDLVDYLSMSYGTSWQSCHELFNLHSLGTIAYALNENVLIAYVADEKNPLRKAWRQVVYCDKKTGFAIGSRNYPSCNDLASATARNLWQTAYNNSENTDNFIFTKDSGKLSEYIITENDFAYIDVSKYTNLSGSWGTWTKENGKNDITVCNEEIICPTCGEWHDDHVEYSVSCFNCNEESVYCDECCSYHHEDDVTYVESVGYYVCDCCLENSFTYCEDCGGYHRDDEGEYVDDQWVCNSCLEENYIYCEDCNDWFKVEDTVYIENYGSICDYCYNNGEYYQCEDCGEYYQVNEIYFIENYGTVCEHCYDRDEYYQCDDCGEHYKGADICYHENVGKTLCCNCVCSSEYSECELCNKLHYADNLHEKNDELLCDSCLENCENDCE